MPKYGEPQEGEWVYPRRDGYKMACCDCGFVHRIDFRYRKRHIEMRVFRDNRSTGQMRRHHNIKVQHPNMARKPAAQAAPNPKANRDPS